MLPYEQITNVILAQPGAKPLRKESESHPLKSGCQLWLAVHFQPPNGCTTNVSFGQNGAGLFIDAKVILPMIIARIEKTNLLLRQFVKSGEVTRLMYIAGATSQSQITQFIPL